MTSKPLAAIEAREAALEEDHLNLRRLPPVAPITPPRRFSQTLLRHANTCKRAAYLYVRHNGGMPAHALDRGTVFHMAKARVLDLLLEQHSAEPELGQQEEQLRDETLHAQPDAEGKLIDEDTAKLMLEEVLAEHPEFTVPLHERDELRIMMVHLANGFPLDISTIVGVERKFVLDLGEHTISGILDLACIEGTTGIVRDSKTEWMPAADEYEATFQGRLYAVLLTFGNPVAVYDCNHCEGVCSPWEDAHNYCPTCKGRGYIEELEPRLGSVLDEVDVGELFPRHLNEQGEIPVLNKVFSRLEVEALRRDIEDQCNALAYAFRTGEFPAVSGSHCRRCPCEPECPLPRHLRRFAGAIQTDAQAKEAAEWHMFWQARLDSTRAEIKSWCKEQGIGLRFGTDQEWDFQEVLRSQPVDWQVLQQANEQTAQTGQVIDVASLRTKKVGSEFKRRTLTDGELMAEKAETKEGSR